jgi:hypothetical protein
VAANGHGDVWTRSDGKLEGGKGWQIVEYKFVLQWLVCLYSNLVTYTGVAMRKRHQKHLVIHNAMAHLVQ